MSGEDVWELGLGRWEIYFGLVLACTIIYVMAGDGIWPGAVIATALLLAMVPWYHMAGRRTMGREAPGPLPYVYVAGLIVLSTGAYWAAPASALVLFALCPQCFMIMRWLPASLAVVLLNFAPAVRFLKGAHTTGSVISFTVWTVITVTFSVIFGLWVERIITQSIERRDLIEQLEATRSELADVSREAGVMAERERLAAEIHDTLAQGFTSILMLLQAAEPRVATDPDEARRQIGLAARTARENLAEARALVAAVPPAALGDSSLDEAVRRLTARLGEEFDLDTECVISGEPRRLAARSEVVLLRAAQEGLANVRKHAKAARVAVCLDYGDAAVRLEIRDDGTGFDPHAAHGFGLRGMRERAAQVDGTLDIRSAPGDGTSIAVEVPA